MYQSHIALANKPKRPRESGSHADNDERPSRRRTFNSYYDSNITLPFGRDHATHLDVSRNDGFIHTVGNYQISNPPVNDNYPKTVSPITVMVPVNVPTLIISGACPQGPAPQLQGPCQQNYYSHHFLGPDTTYRDSEDVIGSPGSTRGISRIGTPHREISMSPRPALDVPTGCILQSRSLTGILF